MNKLAYFFIVFLTYFAQCQTPKPVGINIASVSDYSTELVFTDAFKQARKWISSNASGTGTWDTQIDVPLNQNGYPLEIPYNNGINPPQIVKTLLLWDIGSAVPQGQYRLKVTGSGSIKLSNGASGTYICPIDTYVNVTGQVQLDILTSLSSDPISNINFVYPDYVTSYNSQEFTTELLNFLSDFQVIRFMDFTKTNGSLVQNWSDRTTENYFSQSKSSGVAWEYVIALANATNKDIWINIPHKATDSYISELAVFMQNNLNSNLKIYLEYSNELWNAAFSQNSYASQSGQNLGYTGQPWELAWKFTAKRSADLFKIFEDTFTNDNRLIKIIPAQAANSWLTNQLVTYFNSSIYNPHQVTASAIAIAPYFGHEIADEIVNSNTVSSITIPQIIAALASSQETAFGWIAANKIVANSHNLELICYEGGQHLVATGSNVNNEILTQKLIAANHNAAFEALYCDYLDYWYAQSATLFCHFSSHGTYSKWGSWGIRENYQDVLNPKYVALQNCVFNANNLSINDFENKIAIFPNPVTDKLHIYTNNSNFTYRIFDVSGRNFGEGFGSNNEIVSLETFSEGFYWIEIQVNSKINRYQIIKK